MNIPYIRRIWDLQLSDLGAPIAPKGFRLGAFGRYSTLEISDFALPEFLGSIDFIYMLGKLARGGISSLKKCQSIHLLKIT